MTSTDFNIIVEKQFKKCQEVLGVKNTEYTPSDTDRLSYFRKAADLMDVSPKKALFGMLAKHLISISDMCTSNNKFSNDRWSEKITDSINYLLLLKAMIEEENNE